MSKLLLLVFSLMLVHIAFANENNLLLTGDTLGTDEQISNKVSVFVMQNDCNLVLYNQNGPGFVSNTFNQGTACSLSLNNRGQLVIKSSDGSTVWTTTPRSKVGKYAAVIRPDGQVSVYGPAVWSTPDFGFDPNVLATELRAVPLVRNLLFSDEILNNSTQLSSRDYTFAMQSDCNLVLTKASLGDIWDSATPGKGQHCYARLNHQGLVTVQNDQSKTLWTSKATSKQGDYVLIMQINGQVAVYGPVVWSTASS